jgi:hypothetical protein
MADVIPFRAHRYDLGRVGALSSVLALPGDVPSTAYHAAHLPGVLRDLLRDDVLVQDSSRSLYVLEQQFGPHTRRGFLARVGEPGEGIVPAVATYADEDGEVMAALDKVVGRRPPLEAVDSAGTVNRLWAVSDQHAVSVVCGLMGPRPVSATGLVYLVSDDQPSGPRVPAGLVIDLGA